MDIPPYNAPGQPYPHPFRQRGEFGTAPEQRFEIRDAVTHVHHWTYRGSWTRTDYRTKTVRHAGPAKAREALDAMVAKARAAGWAELPKWPEVPAGWAVPSPPATPKPDPPLRSKPVPLAKVRMRGNAQPTTPDPIITAFKTDVPPSYAALLKRRGAGIFAGRLRFPGPDEIVRSTKKWRKSWRHDHGRTFFVNYDRVLGERAMQLVLVASSIEGDQVGFVAGDPSAFYTLPRNRNTVVVSRSIEDVLGWYLAIAKLADGKASPTYEPDPPQKKQAPRRAPPKKKPSSVLPW